jgi:hypothetical protein
VPLDKDLKVCEAHVNQCKLPEVVVKVYPKQVVALLVCKAPCFGQNGITSWLYLSPFIGG